ncbi:MAG: site-specific integrase [Oscillospiraceae bacterium]|nr:site-specific integrase [Oscillospiraceae bacterium]
MNAKNSERNNKKKQHQHKIGKYKYYRVQRSINGQKKSFYGATLREAKAKAEAYRKAHTLTAAKREITFREYASCQLAYLANQISPATYVGYEEKIRLRALPLLGDKLLTEITHDDILQVMSGATRYSPSYRHTLLMLLRHIFKAALRSNLIAGDPTDWVKANGGKQRKQKPALSNEQCEQLLSAVRGTQAETFCLIGIYTGLRREEILALMWDAVYLDSAEPYVEVKRAWRIQNNRPVISEVLKNAAARRNIPIPQQLANHLRMLRATTASKYVISNTCGEPLSGTQWRNLWRIVERRTTAPRKYSRYANGTKTEHMVTPTHGANAKNNPGHVYSLDFSVTPHQLRYTYVTNLIAAGLDIKKVQYLAGHKSIKITLEIYARVKDHNPKDLSDAINMIFTDDHSPEGK